MASAAAPAQARRTDGVTAGWEALGTSVVVRVTRADALGAASRVVEAELRAIDQAASRFRRDSELERLNAAGGRRVVVSRLLHEALAAGIRAAVLTDGAVDPTLGDAIVLAGYDRDWHQLAHSTSGEAHSTSGEAHSTSGEAANQRPRLHVVTARPTRSWEYIELDDDPPAARLLAGVRVDLGATAKALAADRGARAAARETGVGVLVSLGGDVATAGAPPESGWLVHVTDDHRSPATAPGQTVAICSGGLATSSTTVRGWLHAGRSMHHILDPTSGEPVASVWRTASVAAATCLDANIASTAAIVLGRAAADWLGDRRLPARLVGRDGRVLRVGDWPGEVAGDASVAGSRG